MLVLSRKLDERILIGDDVVVTVVSIRGGVVQLGIEAPRHVRIHREEVREQHDESESGTRARGADAAVRA